MQPTLSDQTAGDKALPGEDLPSFQRPPAELEDLRVREKKKTKTDGTQDGSTPPVPGSETPESTTPDGETQGKTAPRPLPVVQAIPVVSDPISDPVQGSNGTFGMTLHLPAAQNVSRMHQIKSTRAPTLLQPATSVNQLPAVRQTEQHKLVANATQSRPSNYALPNEARRSNDATSRSKPISTEKIPSGLAPVDAPPALPATLKRATAHGRTALPAGQIPDTIQAPGGTNAIQDQRVKPAEWNQPSGIRLINPAAALAEAPDGRPLRQAIYYKAVTPDTKPKK